MLKKVLIMAGGTGGHVFPALAIAQKLQEQNVHVAWLGTSVELEARVVPQHNIPLYCIQIKGIRCEGLWRYLTAPFQILRALIKALSIIYRYQPDVVLGMGGYASGPGGLAAVILRKSLIIHEQNAVLGLTNRILSRFAKKVLTGFPLSNPQFIFVGNPVREEISKIPPPKERLSKRSGRTNLLVFGGSQGSRKLNQIIPQTIALIPPNQRPSIWHQIGRLADQKEILECYQKYGVEVRIDDFIQDMASAYMWADLVICRSGASSIAELTVAGVPALLIPLPHAVDDHQTMNAQYLVRMNSAVLLPEKKLTPERLKTAFLELNDRQKQLTMAEAARRFCSFNSLNRILQELES